LVYIFGKDTYLGFVFCKQEVIFEEFY